MPAPLPADQVDHSRRVVRPLAQLAHELQGLVERDSGPALALRVRRGVAIELEDQAVPAPFKAYIKIFMIRN